MSRYSELDDEIVSIGTPGEGRGISLADATIFISALRKIAAEGQPAPDADLVEHQTEVATGEEASPAEAEAHTQAASPDETGHLEGEFAVPLEQVVQTLAQIVSNSMRQHSAYAFYGEMMRDLGRGELSELFDEQGEAEIKEMKYFLRRMSVLQPGGVPIPVAPTPQPSPDIQAALSYLIAGEQQAIVLFKTLHSMLGENPMKYTIEQTMTDAQEHLDRLWQYMPATSAPASAPKLASVVSRMKLAARKIASPQQPTPQKGDIPVGAPGTEPLSSVLGRESMLAQAQLMHENQDLKGRMDMAGQQQLMAQQQIESLGAENENLQAQAMSASDQAQMATEQAQLSSEQAAAQADAKMRISIRVNQLRQQLADIVSADPVQEEGVSFGEQAGPGSVTTSSQQGQMAQQAAAMDPSGGMGGAPTAEAGEQQQEAANAQQEAQEQTAQAQQKTKADSSKPKKPGAAGTTVEVKTSAKLPPVRVIEDAAKKRLQRHQGSFASMLKRTTNAGQIDRLHKDHLGDVSSALGDTVSSLASKGHELTGRLGHAKALGAVGTVGGAAAGFAAGRTSSKEKTSSIASAVRAPLVQAGHSIGEGIGQHLEQAGSDAVRGGLKTLKERVLSHSKNPKVIAAAGVGAGVLAGKKVYDHKKQNDRDLTQKQILEAVRTMANR